MPGSPLRLSPESPEAAGPSSGRPSDPARVVAGSGSVKGSGSGGSSTPRVPPADLPSLPIPGERLESFEIHEPIGAGGMGAVFLATDTRLDRQVALKVLPPEQSLDPETVQRFYHEGRAAARLDHENIARVFTIGHDRGLHFIAFEYVEGTTLRQRVEQRGPLAPAEAVDISLQITDALIHSSSRGVVHRDIKPSNIIVTPRGRAKLVDMGLARRFERGKSDHGLTQSGMTLGTFDYISPEQARDPRNVDIRSDLYSLGCTIYHMLTGRPPFPDGTVLQKLIQHQEEPAPDVRGLNPAVPAPLAAIILRLMAKDRDRRFQSPEQLREELAIVARSLGVDPGSTPAVAVRQPGMLAWERHLVWGLPAIALALIVAGVFLWGPPPEPSLRDTAPILPSTTPLATRPRVTSAPAPAGDPRPQTQPTEASGPRRIGSTDDLAAAIAAAPSGSTLLLTDNGPYRLTPVENDLATRSTPATRRNLTIKADALARPVIRPEWPRAEPRGDLVLLPLPTGIVRVEGLEFDLGRPPRTPASISVLAGLNVELALSQCLFRGPIAAEPAQPVVAVDLRSVLEPQAEPSMSSSLPSPGRAGQSVRLRDCVFTGGLSGIRARGPLDIDAHSNLFAGSGSVLWLDNTRPAQLIPVDARLRDLRVVVAGPSPTFRFSGAQSRLIVEDSVFAIGKFSDPVAATLIEVEQPDRLDWRGRENLYGGISAFLQTAPGSTGSAKPIREWADWADGEELREIRSKSTTSRVWADADPLARIAQRRGEIVTAFALDQETTTTPTGPARPGSSNALARVSESLTGFVESALANRNRRTKPSTPKVTTSTTASTSLDKTPSEHIFASEPSETSVAPMPVAPGPTTVITGASSANALVEVASNAGNSTAPMNQSPTTGNSDTITPAPMFPFDLPPADNPEPATEVVSNEDLSNRSVPTDVIRTAADWRRRTSELPARGGTLRLSGEARLSVSPISIPRAARWVIQGVTGGSRPRVRLQIDEQGPRAGESPPLFRLAAGASLELRDLDLLVDVSTLPRAWAGALFDLEPGSDLSVIGCTVTLAPRDPFDTSCSVVRIGNGQGAGDTSTATLRIENSFVRCGGDVIEIGAGVRADCSITGSVLLSSGTAVRAQGRTRGQTGDRSKLTLRQSTVRATGGLVRLTSSPDRPELPTLEINARDSILATNTRGDALLRVESQDDLEALRNRVLWDGQGVVYHLIDVYRLDQTAAAGASSAPYRRLSWDVAVGPREGSPFHGDVRFAVPFSSDQRLWELGRDDVKLAADSPVGSSGARLNQVPEPPSVEAR